MDGSKESDKRKEVGGHGGKLTGSATLNARLGGGCSAGHSGHPSGAKPCAARSSRDSHTSHSSHTCQSSATSSPLLKPRGDYHTLLSYQKADVIFEITYRFCKRFLSKGDRTIDQMVQAARSGKQNIVEGSKAGTTSKESEIKLTNVARASLEELLEDYCDFLRVRDQRIWSKDSREARYVRAMGKASPLRYDDFREFVETRPADVVANITICLIHQANYLLDRQLQSLGASFLKDGGLRERMTRARLQAREERRVVELEKELRRKDDR